MAEASQDMSELEAVDSSEGVGRLSTQIIPHLLNLYNSTCTPQDFEIYTSNAVFADPFMIAHGVGQIKSAFYAMPKVFWDSTILDYKVEEDETSPTSGEIRIHNLQQYKLLQLGPFGYYLTLQSLIILTVEAGKVTRHEDRFGGYRLWDRQTVRVPLVGRMAETVRRGSMLVCHALMGFGRDHKTKNKASEPSFHLKVS
ncbi:uncharacterized protein [Physcomitrium patens]|jgi:hypothetical protein|uniref:NTF2 domain-containing protein n=2 Tax=Physcomitrium patens TaxID=3218 RepID=A0A2K1L3U7_PHYPA|nr:uncharacterized protein LOC112295538 isoform X1 [Physcomitrium patens]PNR60697.1 hypothetical protein PHYPA_003490 [Physcomitrium patens]|eukprot:XP_024403057.1 uncharacterized protein LOC112295538 isoform X1 [Physcomitrella patens]